MWPSLFLSLGLLCWRICSANIALGKDVIASSHDFLFNKEGSCLCKRGGTKVDWNDNYFFIDELIRWRQAWVNQYDGGNPPIPQADRYKYNEGSLLPNGYKDTMVKWCKIVYGMGEPDSINGDPGWKPSFSDGEWKILCWSLLNTAISGGQGIYDPKAMNDDDREKFYNPNFLFACRAKLGDLVVSTLTDGGKMDPAKNNETHREHEVRTTCFKSKWQRNPWVMVDLKSTVKVGKVKLFNRLEARGEWELGNYPVYPKLKDIPPVSNPPWIWNRFDKFQVFVLDDDESTRWKTWDRKREEITLPWAKIRVTQEFRWELNIGWNYWEISKGKSDSNYKDDVKNNAIGGAKICDFGNNNGVKMMEKWKTDFNEKDAQTTKDWVDFASRNYPFVVDCAGLSGRYVAIRLLNDGRSPTAQHEQANFINDTPFTLCEIEVEEA